MATATKKPMSKTQLVALLAEQIEVTKKQAALTLEVLAETAYKEAKKGGFTIPGIGKLVMVKRKARMGATPPPARRSRFRPRRLSSSAWPRPARMRWFPPSKREIACGPALCPLARMNEKIADKSEKPEAILKDGYASDLLGFDFSSMLRVARPDPLEPVKPCQ